MTHASSLTSQALLVTGAPGWLCDALLPRLAGARVRCLIHRSLPDARVAAWRKEHPEVTETAPGDMLDPASLKAACQGLGGGMVLHAAGLIHVRRTRDWYAVNRDGTLALARAAKEAGVRRFVYVSSNAAQGRAASPQVLLTEDMPCCPGSHYGRSKYQAEQGLLTLHDPGRFDVVVARPCMFYGPPVPQRHVDIFQRIRRGRLPLVGGGQYARSLTYIDDLVACVLLCLTHPKAPGEIFNVCDARAYTTREVCDAMAAALGVPAKFVPLPAFSAGIARAIDCALAAFGFYSMPFHLLGEANWNVGCSSKKAQDVLGFKPTVEVFEGYRRAVAWCKERKLLD
ncbi:MAG: NAD-dependent epimerase/dehydratase family protein [Planctomycetota bacterium]|nr:NAD-dependent epimerase/dehydratase family protein [Planctomycetota bacterium]